MKLVVSEDITMKIYSTGEEVSFSKGEHDIKELDLNTERAIMQSGGIIKLIQDEEVKDENFIQMQDESKSKNSKIRS